MGNILKIGQCFRIGGYLLSKGQDVRVALKGTVLTSMGLDCILIRSYSQAILSRRAFYFQWSWDRSVYFYEAVDCIGKERAINTLKLCCDMKYREHTQLRICFLWEGVLSNWRLNSKVSSFIL